MAVGNGDSLCIRVVRIAEKREESRIFNALRGKGFVALGYEGRFEVCKFVGCGANTRPSGNKLHRDPSGYEPPGAFRAYS